MPKTKGKASNFGGICLWDPEREAWVEENDPTFQNEAQNGTRGVSEALTTRAQLLAALHDAF